MCDEHIKEAIEEAVRRFEQAWQSGEDTGIEQFLSSTGTADRQRVLVRLVKIDQDYRWRAEHPRFLEDYLRDWPELANDAKTISELLDSECAVRASLGSPPSQRELQERFPTLFGRVDLGTVAVDADAAPSGPADPVRPTATPDTLPARGDTTPTPLPSWYLPSSGGRVGRYEVRSLIGAGGMGEVYRAYDTELQREVALKIPRVAPQAKPDILNRFVQETLAAASIRHPNICPVYDAGRVDDRYYIVMALIEGTNLAERLEQGPCTPEFAVRVMAQLARALDAAHEAGVIHRDIKPANVLLDKSDQPLLTDFGLARRTESRDQLTATGTFMGTPAYMSPEQAALQSVDRRTDVYSLGVVLYQMLTGVLPFPGPPTQLLMQIAKGKPPKPSQVRSDLDPALEKICLRAMARAPKARYQTAGEFAGALEQYAVPVVDPAVGSPKRIYWAIAAMILVIGIGGLITGWSDLFGRGDDVGTPPLKPPPVEPAPPPLTEREIRIIELEAEVNDLAAAEEEIEAVRQLGEQFCQVKTSVWGMNAQAVGRETVMRLAKLTRFELSERELEVATRLEEYSQKDGMFHTPEDGYLLLREIAEMMSLRLERTRARLERLRSVTEESEEADASGETELEVGEGQPAQVAVRLAAVGRQLKDLEGAEKEIAGIRELQDDYMALFREFIGNEAAALVAIKSHVLMARLMTYELTADEMAMARTAQGASFRLGAFSAPQDVYGPARDFAERVHSRFTVLKNKRAGLEKWSPENTSFYSGIEMRPEKIQALCDEARIHGGCGEWKQAIAVISKAAEAAPDDALVLAKRASFHADDRNWEAAIVDCERAIDLANSLGYAYYVRGYVNTERGLYALAVGDCSKAIQLDPALARAYRTRAVAYNHAAAHARAEEDCSAAIAINPQYSDAYRVRALARLALGNLEPALEDCNTAIDLDNVHAQAYYVRASVFVEMQEYRNAADDLTRAIDLWPQDSRFFRLRAQCYEKLEETLRAAADIHRATRLEAKTAPPSSPAKK